MDVKDKGIIISILHPGFMRTEMTAGVGFDKYWDDGGGEFTTLLGDGWDWGFLELALEMLTEL